MAITGAIPFAVIVLLQIVGFMREIRKEIKEPDVIEARGEIEGKSPTAGEGTA